MKNLFFLTALFENKYGTAKKYYNKSGWHWMLNFDKPKMYETKELAEFDIHKFGQAEREEVEINQVLVYKNLWEHKIKWEDVVDFVEKVGEPKDVVESVEHKKNYLFLSHTKQMDNAQLLQGLYCLSRKQDHWIYCI